MSPRQKLACCHFADDQQKPISRRCKKSISKAEIAACWLGGRADASAAGDQRTKLRKRAVGDPQGVDKC